MLSGTGRSRLGFGGLFVAASEENTTVSIVFFIVSEIIYSTLEKKTSILKKRKTFQSLENLLEMLKHGRAGQVFHMLLFISNE